MTSPREIHNRTHDERSDQMRYRKGKICNLQSHTQFWNNAVVSNLWNRCV